MSQIGQPLKIIEVQPLEETVPEKKNHFSSQPIQSNSQPISQGASVVIVRNPSSAGDNGTPSIRTSLPMLATTRSTCLVRRLKRAVNSIRPSAHGPSEGSQRAGTTPDCMSGIDAYKEKPRPYVRQETSILDSGSFRRD